MIKSDSQANNSDSQANNSAESQTPDPEEITRDDLVAKFTELRESMPYLGEDSSVASENTMKVLAAGMGLAAAYFYGWRKGRSRNKTVIEVRRI